MKRICIYLIYDKQNIVDDYIGYILRELNSCVDCLITVCNMPELICGKDILKENSDIIFFGKILVLMQVDLKKFFVV